MRIFILSALLAIVSLPAMAGEVLRGPYQATPYTVRSNDHDGDTFRAHVTIWLGQVVKSAIRINGIDTPEIRGKCVEEKVLALKAKSVLWELLSTGDVELYNIRYGKWAGRVLADVVIDGENVSDILINKGLARVYDGGKRQSWCHNVDL